MTRGLAICLVLLIGCAPGTAGPEVPVPQDEPPVAPSTEPSKPKPLAPHPISKLKRLRIQLADQPFVLEVADDMRSRGRGLSGRTRVAPTEGMLFVYPEPRELGFWMNECLTDLDILYVDKDGRIKSMHRMKTEPPRREGEQRLEYEARLPRYRSVHLVQFALEFATGTIDRLGLRLGDTVELPRRELIESAR